MSLIPMGMEVSVERIRYVDILWPGSKSTYRLMTVDRPT